MTSLVHTADHSVVDNLPMQLRQMDQQFWRLNNLYYIVNDQGIRLPFKLRPIQEAFLRDMWYRNVILKSRQHGFTTLIDLWTLDCVLFVENITAAIIAQTQDLAQKIFETKVEFPYKNLPDGLRAQFPIDRSNLHEIKFLHNNSTIIVTPTPRSGTTQILHVSELGKIAKENPKKAREIRTGGYPTSHQGSYIFVESTAEGNEGEFYTLAQQAINDQREGNHLTPLTFKFHFYAWHEQPNNRMSDEDAIRTLIPARLTQYFDSLETEYNIFLDVGQKAWYAETEKVLEGDMKREHPSHPDEAFDAATEGAYFAHQMARMREEGRITTVPYTDGYQVHTFWDLGINDEMAIWFAQKIGEKWHLIHYYEDTDYGMDWYIDQLFKLKEETGWIFGQHWAPHDIEKRELSTAVTTWQQAKEKGITFNVVSRPERKSVSILAARRIMSICSLDREKCADGITCLDNYRKQWDDIRGCWKDIPLHNRASNGADAFQTFALAVEKMKHGATRHSARQDPRRQALVDTVSADNLVASVARPRRRMARSRIF